MVLDFTGINFFARKEFALKEIGNIAKKTIIAGCEFLLVLSIILECYSGFLLVYDDRGNIGLVLELIIVCTGILLIGLQINGLKGCQKIYTSIGVTIMLIWGWCLLFWVINVRKVIQYFETNYIIMFMIMLPILIILFRIYKEKGMPFHLFYKMETIMIVLAIVSVVLWLGIVIFDGFTPGGKVMLNWGGVFERDNYYNLSFITEKVQMEKISFWGRTVNRNIGIFPESPMYNIFLCCALYTELFLKRKSSLWKTSVLFVTILTTMGTLGIGISVFGFMLKLTTIVKIGNIKYKRYIIISLLAVFALFTILLIINKRNGAMGSYSTRVDDFVAPMKQWVNNPFWGCGYENEEPIRQYMSEFRKNNLGVSNSIAVSLAESGIFMWFFYLLPFVLLMSRFFKQGKRIAYWGMGMFALFITTIFLYKAILIMFFAFAFSMITWKVEIEDKGQSVVWKGQIVHFNKADFSGNICGCRKELMVPILTIVVQCVLAFILFSFCTGCSLSDAPHMFALRYRLYLQDSQWRFLAFVTVLTTYGAGIYNILIAKKEKLCKLIVGGSILLEVVVALVVWGA